MLFGCQLATVASGTIRVALVDTALPVWAGVAPVVVRDAPAPLRAVADPVTPELDPVWVVVDTVAEAAPPGPDGAGRDRVRKGCGTGSRLVRVLEGLGGPWVAGLVTTASRAGLASRALTAGELAVALVALTGVSQVSHRLSVNWVKSGSASITTWYWFRGL